MVLTPHFTLAEATITRALPDNSPDATQLARIKNTAHEMEIVRAVLGRSPIKVNSWFRSPKVNEAVGGVPTSEHVLGAAVDFTCSVHGTPYKICQSLLAAAHILNYNQLIYEGTWVHISFPLDGQRGKREILTKLAGRYHHGLIER